MGKSVKKNFSLSYCITCDERNANYLQQTLVKNIRDNFDYKKAEFIIVEFNASGVLKSWLEKQFPVEMSKNKIKYHPINQNRSQTYSRCVNQAFRLCSGDIICILQPHQFTGMGFAKYVNNSFNRFPNTVITTIDHLGIQPGYCPPQDAHSRIVVQKKELLAVGGFDERMEKTGSETLDLTFRLQLAGLSMNLIDDFYFFMHMPYHANNEKKDPVTKLLIHQCDPYSSQIIIFYADHACEMGKFIDSSRSGAEHCFSSFKIKQQGTGIRLFRNAWIKGSWSELSDRSGFTLNMLNGSRITILQTDLPRVYKYKDRYYYNITDNHELLNFIEVFNRQSYNRNIFEDNVRRGVIKVNMD